MQFSSHTPFFSVCLYPKIVSVEGAWIFLSVLPMKCPFILCYFLTFQNFAQYPCNQDSQGVWDGHVHTAIFKMDNQQGPTWNSAQCYVAAQTRGEFGGDWTHAYVWLGRSAVHLKLSQHYQLAIIQCKIKSFKKLKEKINRKKILALS